MTDKIEQVKQVLDKLMPKGNRTWVCPVPPTLQEPDQPIDCPCDCNLCAAQVIATIFGPEPASEGGLLTADIDEIRSKINMQTEVINGIHNKPILTMPHETWFQMWNMIAQAVKTRHLMEAEWRKRWAKSDNEIEQILGKALGYPWYKDDQKNFPGATEADGVCVGDHVPATLAMEAARKIQGHQAEKQAMVADFEDWLEGGGGKRSWQDFKDKWLGVK